MVTDSKTRTELLELEKRFWEAMLRKDADAAWRMTADDCVIVGAQGVSAIDPITMAKLTREGPWKLEQYEFDEKTAQVHLVSDNVAVVAYKVRERLQVDDKPLTLEANDSSVWVQRDGKWVCAMHTESPAGDPFGRDREA